MTTQSAKRFFCLQESRSGPAHGHLHIAIVCDSSAHPSYHGVRRLNDVGGGQATRQFPGYAKPVDGEQFFQSFEQAGSRIWMLRLEMLGMGFEFLDAGLGVAFERLDHYTAGLRRTGFGKALGDIAHLVSPATLNMGCLAAKLLNPGAQRLRSVDHPQAGKIHVHPALGKGAQQVLTPTAN